MVTCNGRALPLQPTGTAGEYVAGVRYKAWQPPSALHPTIAVHAPLTFDIVDTWIKRSLGGCEYHVGASGRAQLRDLPGQRLRSRGRRLARFQDHGHTPGFVTVPAEEPPGEYPLTLDLRRPSGV